MKIILLGSTGMLGNYLKTYLNTNHQLLALTRNDIDLSTIDEKKIIDFFSSKVTKDDTIINASGIIKQRDHKAIDMIMVNSVLPHILSKIKIEIGCNVIHITTDCVFSGKKGGYVESDEHDCLDDYGKSKSLGENPLLTIIRTSIIGEEKANKKSLLEWVKSNEGKMVDGYANHLWNGVTCLELSKLIEQLVQSKQYWEGVKHIFSPNTVSKFELVSLINDTYNLHIKVKEKSTTTACHRNLATIYDDAWIKKSLQNQIIELKAFTLGEIS